MKKTVIVLTGGPSGGKTTLIEALQKDMGSLVAVVPEAATILYRGGFPRRTTIDGRKHVQRAIYYTQKELELMIINETQSHLIVCDRGSLDSIAYWPDSEENLFESLKTTKSDELKRYDWVIHLDTALVQGFDNSNPHRVENHTEALDINGKIKEAWSEHPRRIIIPHQEDFLSKISKAKSLILDIAKNPHVLK